MNLLEDHVIKNHAAYAPGVLTPRQHFQLVEELSRYCKIAGIAEEYVTHSMVDYCNGFPEVDWARHYPQQIKKGVYGIVFVKGDTVLTRMSAITGCMLRNYISARMVTLQVLLDELKNGDFPTEHCLCISNFCLLKNQGGDIASWQLPLIIGLLYERFAHQKQTIVYAPSILAIQNQYGLVIKNHIERYFNIFSEIDEMGEGI